MRPNLNVSASAGANTPATPRPWFKSPDSCEPLRIVIDLPVNLPVISAEFTLVIAFLDEAIDKILNARPSQTVSSEADEEARASVSP